MQFRAIKYALVIFCGFLTVYDACAANSAGTVKTVSGMVYIERTGVSSPAHVGSELYSSDRIVTAPESSVGITLRDNTLLAVGASSTLELNQFKFDTTTHEGALNAIITRGSLAVVNGKLAKTNPDAVQYRTPTTTLGVRGTEFIIQVGSDSQVAP